MKKLFTLLAAVILPLCAMANPVETPVKITAKGLKATPEMYQRVASLHEQAESITADNVTSGNVIKRMYNDGKNTYRLLINYAGYKLQDWWWFLDENKDTITFEQMPFYVVEYDLCKYDEHGKVESRADCLVTWPSYKMWEISNSDFADNLEMVPLHVIGSKQDDGLCSTFGFFSEDDVTYQWDKDAKQITCYAIWTNKKDNWEQKYDGQAALFDDPSATRTSMFTINDYEPETEYISSRNQFYFKQKDNPARKGQMIVNFEGTCRVQGFYKDNLVWNVSAVDVFNAGLKDPDSLTMEEDVYEFEWTPKQMFWVYVATEYCEVARENENVKKFNPSNIYFKWRDDVPDAIRNNENYYSMYGPIYAPGQNPEFEYPNGVYKMQKPYSAFNDMYNMTMLKCIPEDYTMIPRGFDDYDWSNKYGFKCIWQGYYQNLESPGKLGIGTTEGFTVLGYDQLGNHITAQYTGTIRYHEDPEDITKVREIASVGEIDSVAAVAADNDEIWTANGMVNVACKADSQVTVYTLSGQVAAMDKCKAGAVTNIALPKGMYIVKTNKTVSKVAL